MPGCTVFGTKIEVAPWNGLDVVWVDGRLTSMTYDEACEKARKDADPVLRAIRVAEVYGCAGLAKEALEAYNKLRQEDDLETTTLLHCKRLFKDLLNGCPDEVYLPLREARRLFDENELALCGSGFVFGHLQYAIEYLCQDTSLTNPGHKWLSDTQRALVERIQVRLQKELNR